MLKKHEKLGVEVEINTDFTQAQYEKYQELLIKGGKEIKSSAAYNRVVIESATESKIITAINGSIEKPVAVKWVTLQVVAAISEALEIPQE